MHRDGARTRVLRFVGPLPASSTYKPLLTRHQATAMDVKSLMRRQAEIDKKIQVLEIRKRQLQDQNERLRNAVSHLDRVDENIEVCASLDAGN